MKELMFLIKKDFSRQFGFLSSPKLIFSDKKVRNRYIAVVAIVIFFLFAQYHYQRFLNAFLPSFIMKGLGLAGISVIIVSVNMLIFLFNTGMATSDFFFSNDVSIMLRFPIKPRNMIISKLLSYTLAFSIIFGFFAIPLFFKYNNAIGRTQIFLLPHILSFVSNIMIVLAIQSLIILIIMSYLNKFARIKNVLQFVALGFIAFLNIFLQIFVRQLIELKVFSSIENFKDFLSPLYLIMPQLKLINTVMESDSIVNALLYAILLLLIAITMIYLCARVGTPFMIKGIFRNQVKLKKRKFSKGTEDGFKYRSVAMELALKDIKEMFKVPIYFFNVSIGAIAPVMIVLLLYLQNGKEFADKTLSSIRYLPNLMHSTFDNILFGIVAGFLLAFMIGTMQQTAVSSFTREGKRFWMMQHMPIDYQTQINGRVIGSLLFQSTGIIINSALFLFIIMPKLSFFISYLLGLVIGAYFIANLGIFFDVLGPKLDWDTPQQAIKNNFKIAMFTLISMAYIFGLGFLTFKVFHLIPINVLKFFIILVIGVHLLLGFIINKLSIKILGKKLSHYEIE